MLLYDFSLIHMILNHLNKKYTLSIMDIDGGEKTNAIPREAVALLAVKLEDESF